jgi:molecular chaperone GrpE
MGKKPQKIDVERALSEGAARTAGGAAEDEIQIVEVSGGDPSAASALEPALETPAPEAPPAAPAAAPASAELDAALERLKRLQAEHENYRKRVERDRGEHREQANAEMLRTLLPALDSFERALADGAAAAAGEFGSGVALIQRQLTEALVRAGLEPQEDKGAVFDPERHEAVATTVEPGAAPGTILQVFERGYRFRGRLLRPARVRVAAGGAAGGAGAGGEGTTRE